MTNSLLLYQSAVKYCIHTEQKTYALFSFILIIDFIVFHGYPKKVFTRENYLLKVDGLTKLHALICFMCC